LLRREEGIFGSVYSGTNTAAWHRQDWADKRFMPAGSFRNAFVHRQVGCFASLAATASALTTRLATYRVQPDRTQH
jgi:hypothetical protein